ncbi:putative cytochrome P450 [Helianthus debilis subsp. tardiflorus]
MFNFGLLYTMNYFQILCGSYNCLLSLAQNPSAENKIRKEIQNKTGGRNWKTLTIKDFEGLIYLHGGLCEALRLYPPVSLEHKAPTKTDVLPTDHVVDKETRIILSFYSMGRMEGLWGGG